MPDFAAAVSDRTAASLINDSDDMGIFNPEIEEWTRIFRDAGRLCFYDHENFNVVIGKACARVLGIDACMFMFRNTSERRKAPVALPREPIDVPNNRFPSCQGRRSSETESNLRRTAQTRIAQVKRVNFSAMFRKRSRPTHGCVPWVPMKK